MIVWRRHDGRIHWYLEGRSATPWEDHHDHVHARTAARPGAPTAGDAHPCQHRGRSLQSGGRRSAQAVRLTPAAALIRVLTMRPIQPAWFSPAFLSVVGLAHVQQRLDQLTTQLGQYRRISALPGRRYQVHFQDGACTARIALDERGRMDGLAFSNPTLPSAAALLHGTFPHDAAGRAAAVGMLLTQRARDQLFSGAALVAIGRRVVLAAGYGDADLARRRTNTITTEFRIGSISKQFAAVAILQLQQAHKLSLHDHLCHYIAGCPRAWAPITLRELLTHTSGLPTDLSVPGTTIDTTKPISLARAIAYLKRLRLDRPPGRSYEYSNANYDLLGYIVAQIAHQPYATYLQQHIFAPLHLQHSGYDQNHPDPRQHATGYSAWATPAPYVDLSWVYAAGALYSTVGDLWHWDQALADHVLISRAATADMFAAHAAMCSGAEHCGSFDAQAYGYGWVRGRLGGHLVLWHNGAINGFVAVNAFLPGDHMTIVVLSNLQTSGVADVLGTQIMKIMVGLA